MLLEVRSIMRSLGARNLSMYRNVLIGVHGCPWASTVADCWNAIQANASLSVRHSRG